MSSKCATGYEPRELAGEGERAGRSVACLTSCLTRVNPKTDLQLLSVTRFFSAYVTGTSASQPASQPDIHTYIHTYRQTESYIAKY